ncbi:MAG TPA: SDR family oxidoreductase [Gemmatimonadales bacterium]|nr:SDR family oxidoreductase [Gemmatimonadales bacterium]
MTEVRPPLAIVTGASAGIGRVFCERLAARKYDLLVVARDRVRLEALKQELEDRHGVEIEAFPADLTIDTDVSLLIARIMQSPQLTLLINNAGFGTRGPLVSASPAQQEAMLRLHTMAPMRLSQAAVPVLLNNRRGGIVNVSSVASFLFSAYNVNYCATKAYLRTFSEGLAAELTGTGVRVQALCPGFTRSEFHQRMELDVRDIPSWMWMSADSVVDASLKCLVRGPVVCVPGLRYKLLVTLLRVTPRGVIDRVTRRHARSV